MHEARVVSSYPFISPFNTLWDVEICEQGEVPKLSGSDIDAVNVILGIVQVAHFRLRRSINKAHDLPLVAVDREEIPLLGTSQGNEKPFSIGMLSEVVRRGRFLYAA